LQKELLANTAQSSAATNARVDQLVQDLAGFDETKDAVVTLAKDMAYVLAHADNVTECAADGNVRAPPPPPRPSFSLSLFLSAPISSSFLFFLCGGRSFFGFAQCLT
jgi:hypothetical protein